MLFTLVMAWALVSQTGLGRLQQARGRQAIVDSDGARIALRLAIGFSGPPGTEVRSRLITGSGKARWRPITDEDLRRRCGDCAPPGYRFRRSAFVDMDHDGAMDLVELVTDGLSDAVRITYGSGGADRLVLRSTDRRWSDQGVFAVGRHRILINQPESNALVLSEHGERVFAQFIGD